MFEKCGHCVPFEKPEQFCSEMINLKTELNNQY